MRSKPAVASAALLLALALNGCSEQTPEVEPTPQAAPSAVLGSDDEPAVCADLSAIRQSLVDLQDTEVTRGSLRELADRLRTLQEQARQLADGAAAEYAAELDAVRIRANALGSSIDSAASDPSADALGAVRDDLRALDAALGLLVDAVAETC